jgi:hypothetical protein
LKEIIASKSGAGDEDKIEKKTTDEKKVTSEKSDKK